MKLLALPLLALVLLSSCGGKLQNPEFREVGNVKLGKMGLKETSVKLDLRFYNPNDAKLKFKRGNGFAWVEGDSIGRFSVDTAITIHPKSEFSLPVVFYLDMAQFARKSQAIFSNKEILVKVEGTARVGKSGFFVNKKVTYEGKQDISKYIKL